MILDAHESKLYHLSTMKFADYFKVGEVFGYYFRKKDPNRPMNTSLKMMHWTNKISMIGLLIGIVVIIYINFFKK